jgi:hypothetical protein
MADLLTPPDWLIERMPAARGFLESGGWLAFLGVGGLLLLLLLWMLLRGLFRGESQADAEIDLEEDLAALPAPPPQSGDMRLTVDGVPVRLRLVVLAPAGKGSSLDPEMTPVVLDRVVPGLGDVAKRDSPQTRVWLGQLSYEGFANTFHRNTLIPEGEKQPSPWVLLAGRADIGGRQVLLGLALEAVKPSTLGRRTLKPHEWATILRLKVVGT